MKKRQTNEQTKTKQQQQKLENVNIKINRTFINIKNSIVYELTLWDLQRYDKKCLCTC